MREDAFILEITDNKEIVQIQEPITVIEETVDVDTSCSSVEMEDEEALKFTNDTIIRNTSYSQKEILKNIMTLYNNGEAFDCDITASQLKFYLKNRGDEYELPVPKHLFDVYPLSENVKQIVPFQKIPMPDNSLGSIVFDPPFVISPKTCKSALEGKDKS